MPTNKLISQVTAHIETLAENKLLKMYKVLNPTIIYMPMKFVTLSIAFNHIDSKILQPHILITISNDESTVESKSIALNDDISNINGSISHFINLSVNIDNQLNNVYYQVRDILNSNPMVGKNFLKKFIASVLEK